MSKYVYVHLNHKVVGWASACAKVEIPDGYSEEDMKNYIRGEWFHEKYDASDYNWDWPYKARDLDPEGDSVITDLEFLS